MIPRPPSSTLFPYTTLFRSQILPAGMCQRLRRGGTRLLVMVLTVDDHRVAVARVVVHLFPDVEDAAARRVDEHAVLRLQVRKLGHADAERGEDHDIAGGNLTEALHWIVRVGEDLNPHRLDALVDVRIVDNLARQKYPPIGELPARLIRVIDGAIDAVTEAEFFRELDVERPGARLIAHSLKALDDGTLVSARQNRPDLGFQAETLLEIHVAQRNASITFFAS